MRIAVATRFAHRVGGVETYLETTLPALADRGHEVKVWHEFAVPPAARVAVPDRVALAPLDTSGGSDAAADIARWRPDVIFSHGIAAVAVERQLQSIAPFVVMLHAYHGTCVSGNKMHAFPALQPCDRPLGPGCLLRYHARRCGGLSPGTMLTSYREQRLRQTILRDATAVATLSEHMRREAIAQGVAADRVVHVTAFVPPAPSVGHAVRRRDDDTVHLMFVGRMERLKGAHLLLSALELVPAPLQRTVALTLVGDGRDRAALERRAARLTASGVPVRFPGWLAPEACTTAVRTADLLVMPSIWPEPLGLAGLEAAAQGVPCLAFDVGGIRDWLDDGVTGRLVRGPLDARALARALEDCLGDLPRLRRWGAAATESARTRTVASHLAALEDLLEAARGSTSRATALLRHA